MSKCVRKDQSTCLSINVLSTNKRLKDVALLKTYIMFSSWMNQSPCKWQERQPRRRQNYARNAALPRSHLCLVLENFNHITCLFQISVWGLWKILPGPQYRTTEGHNSVSTRPFTHSNVSSDLLALEIYNHITGLPWQAWLQWARR